jgi:ribonuclease Z
MYRNVSAIYLDVFKRGGLLMDCGEGTLGQLNLRYSREQMLELFKNIKCLWISHMHADHHAGTAAFLAARRRALGDDEAEPLLVVGPRGLSIILKVSHRPSPAAARSPMLHTVSCAMDAVTDCNEWSLN